MNKGLAQDWGICGLRLRPDDAQMRDVMADQNGLLVIRNWPLG